MKLSEFKIGGEFRMGDEEYRCTDIGTRVVAIRITNIEMETYDTETKTSTTRAMTRAEAEAIGWFNGPPYGCIEDSFDEYDQEACEPI